MSIRDMEMLGIGEPDDTGGSETAGSVMAKENAVLRKVTEFSQRTLGNMVLKQIGKSSKMPSSGYMDITYEFERPVRIIGIVINPSDTNFSGTFVPTYIINGEDSFSCSTYISNRGKLAVFSRNASGGGFQFYGDYQTTVNVMPVEIWATQVTLHIPVDDIFSAGSTTYSTIYYQEEVK